MDRNVNAGHYKITKHHNQLKISCVYSNDRNRRKERHKLVFFKL